MKQSTVLETTDVPGSAAEVLLNGAVDDHRSSADAGYVDGQPLSYLMECRDQFEWGIGSFRVGNLNAPSLARDTVLGNSAGTTGRMDFAGPTVVGAA